MVSVVKPMAVILGVGDGLSASLARMLHREGYQLTLAARNTDKLSELSQQVGNAACVACDATDATQVQALFAQLPADSPLKVAIYNPSYRVRGPIDQVDPEQVHKSLDITAFGAFLFGQEASKRMLAAQTAENETKGTILFTGASAGMKGFPRSAAFAMGKFAQRGLAQSMARELHPQGIHVAWISVDGGIAPADGQQPSWSNKPDAMLKPDAIAETYLALINQHRSTWTNEIEVRPWVENF